MDKKEWEEYEEEFRMRSKAMTPDDIAVLADECKEETTRLKVRKIPDSEFTLGLIEAGELEVAVDLYQDQEGIVWAKLPFKVKHSSNIREEIICTS